MFVEIEKQQRGRKPNVGSAVKSGDRVSFMLGYSCCPTCRDSFRISVPLSAVQEFMKIVAYQPHKVKFKKKMASRVVKWLE